MFRSNVPRPCDASALLLLSVAALAITCVTSSPASAQGMKLGSVVGQVNGTPSGSPGERVRIDAGLSEAPMNATGYFTAMGGPVKMYYASGSTWRYFGTAPALGSEGGAINTYGVASFNPRISPSAPRRRHIRLKFVYEGDPWHYSATGYGSVYVR